MSNSLSTSTRCSFFPAKGEDPGDYFLSLSAVRQAHGLAPARPGHRPARGGESRRASRRGSLRRRRMRGTEQAPERTRARTRARAERSLCKAMPLQLEIEFKHSGAMPLSFAGKVQLCPF